MSYTSDNFQEMRLLSKKLYTSIQHSWLKAGREPDDKVINEIVNARLDLVTDRESFNREWINAEKIKTWQ